MFAQQRTNRSINQMSKAKPGFFILCLHRLEIKKTIVLMLKA